jgi:hypothetical protein
MEEEEGSKVLIEQRQKRRNTKFLGSQYSRREGKQIFDQPVGE